MRWLVPGGHLAVLWSNSPWTGSQAWQQAMAETVRRWTDDGGGDGADTGEHRRASGGEPHRTVLTSAGFTIVGEFGFTTPHEWTVETLTGSCTRRRLSQPALGETSGVRARPHARLLAVEPGGVFREETSFSYTLGEEE